MFLRRVFELGASANAIDPIWQVMAPTLELGPWTVHGDLAYPTVTTDRFLRDGDIIWVDAGITWQGYASDYGRTWITGRAATPNAKQQDQFHRWRAVVDAALDILKPGVSALQLGKAAIEANDGVRPWIDHFYLAHGIGVDSAEMPLIGTDLGDHFDERLIMQPGMVAVFEPVIWDEGCGWLSLGRHCGGDGYGLGQAERLDVRAVRDQLVSPQPRDRGLLVGTMGLEDDARVDFARLRKDRRDKVFSGLERHGIDALMLGGVGNVRYVSGARQLGRSGVLPFAPVAVAVRQTARVHLLSTWDEGVPPEIGYEDLYRMSWNPANLAADLAKVPGLPQARTRRHRRVDAEVHRV